MLVIEAFDDAEQTLATAQAVPYGLSASIMTRDHARAFDMAQRFDTGIVHINAPTMASEAALPVGGVKDSGWGRSGHYAVEDFTEVRLTTMTSAHRSTPSDRTRRRRRDRARPRVYGSPRKTVCSIDEGGPPP